MRQVGNTFHARNKQLHDKKVATGWSPPPVAGGRAGLGKHTW